MAIKEPFQPCPRGWLILDYRLAIFKIRKKKGGFRESGHGKRKQRQEKRKREKLAWRGEVLFFLIFLFERECA